LEDPVKKIFLTSSVDQVASKISKKIGGQGLKLVFIKTASEVEEGNLSWLHNDRNALINAGFEVADYSITDRTKEEITRELTHFDVIFFSGGNTFYLLQKIQESDCAEALKNLVNQGKIYIGSSAGSIVAGPDIYPLRYLDVLEKAPNIKGYKGMGLVDFVIAPHWGISIFKELYLNERIDHLYNSKEKIILLNDSQYVEVDGDCYKIIDMSDSE
jgi:dipeptidase E